MPVSSRLLRLLASVMTRTVTVTAAAGDRDVVQCVTVTPAVMQCQ